MAETHLTEQQIVYYTAKRLPFSERVEIALHIRVCPQCRELFSRLVPNYDKTVVEQFEALLRQALVAEEPPLVRSTFSNSAARRNWLGTVFVGAWKPQAIAFACLIAVIGVGLLLLNLNQSKQIVSENLSQNGVQQSDSVVNVPSTPDKEPELNESNNALTTAPIIETANKSPKAKKSDVALNRTLQNKNRNAVQSSPNNSQSKASNDSLATLKNQNKSVQNTNSSLILMNANEPKANENAFERQAKLIYPNGETVSSIQPTLRWTGIPNAVKYEIGVFSYQTGKVVVRGVKVASAGDKAELIWTVPEKLQPNETYVWQVIVYLADGSEVKLPRLPERNVRFQTAAQPN